LFIVGITLISCGSLNDLTGENESISSLLPTFIFHISHITSEERFDVIGIVFISLSAILCFRVPLRHFIAKNTKGSLLISWNDNGESAGRSSGRHAWDLQNTRTDSRALQNLDHSLPYYTEESCKISIPINGLIRVVGERCVFLRKMECE
jgi:hypothetical protein